MHFRTAVSVALLACASHVAATAEPYRLAVMPVDGMSLVRRQSPGYQPELTHCHEGNTCAEACGDGYTTCPSNDDSTHCFNPDNGQACCNDGSGNSCDKGYYCTHDTNLQTWCCPEAMDLAACAAAYSVTGGLETAAATTSTPEPSSTSSVETSTPSPSPTSTPEPSSTPLTTSSEAITVTKESASSSGYTTAWSGGNSTISTAAPTQPSESSVPVTLTPLTSAPSAPTATVTGAASAKGVSALLLAAAGLFALF